MTQLQIRHERIDGDGLRLQVLVAGEGPPVILLHGFPENAHSWRHQIAPLASAGYSVWAPNLRGYPPSDIASRRSDYLLPHLVNDVAAIVAATGHGRASIVGHDWGGIIAWAFAGAYPALLRKLVILNAPHMQVYADKIWNTSQLLRSAYVGLFQLPILPEALLSKGNFFLLRQMFKVTPARRGAYDDNDIARYVACLSQPGALKAALDYYRANMVPGGMALARTARTNGPVLVIWGERDPALGTFLLDGVQRFAPRVRIHCIARAGHWVQNEAPDEVNSALLAFLGPPG
ncbi:MAG TPA: alpha/beta fold hydrolase [Noviherbaspirillum sp.]|uniref:alpha/beta fold hydrolase n=1 Tax=Noviherbaspirillum sp. TaxID=1926288 RepID=UPI002D76433A|nr:alpha/beta fold hydrolase [Noviherbaspirillum sp.]HYD94603.1 alpha/beta fold hydrolase [Noviherbaspirillum sp.]